MFATCVSTINDYLDKHVCVSIYICVNAIAEIHAYKLHLFHCLTLTLYCFSLYKHNKCISIIKTRKFKNKRYSHRRESTFIISGLFIVVCSRLERKTNSCSTLSSIANNANAGISGGVSLVSSGTMTASMVATPTSPVTITTAINTAMPSPANSSFTGNGNMVNVSTNATAEDLTDSSLRNKLSV